MLIIKIFLITLLQFERIYYDKLNKLYNIIDSVNLLYFMIYCIVREPSRCIVCCCCIGPVCVLVHILSQYYYNQRWKCHILMKCATIVAIIFSIYWHEIRRHILKKCEFRVTNYSIFTIWRVRGRALRLTYWNLGLANLWCLLLSIFSLLSSVFLLLFLCLNSFLLFSCASVWESTLAWIPYFL